MCKNNNTNSQELPVSRHQTVSACGELNTLEEMMHESVMRGEGERGGAAHRVVVLLAV